MYTVWDARDSYYRRKPKKKKYILISSKSVNSRTLKYNLKWHFVFSGYVGCVMCRVVLYVAN